MEIARDVEIEFNQDWLTVENYEFKILTMVAVLAENNLAYRGKLTNMCEFLGVAARNTNNNNKIKAAIESLEKQHYILVIKQGQTWTLTLDNRASRKTKVVKIRKTWIKLIQEYKPERDDKGVLKGSVGWENILKLLVFLIGDSSTEIKTYDKMAGDLQLSIDVVKRSILALSAIEFEDLELRRRIRWVKEKNTGKFYPVGQTIDVWRVF